MITDDDIIRYFMLETIDSGQDIHRYERRKYITQCERKSMHKRYVDEYVDENIYDYVVNRYSDSSSFKESLYRIAKHIEKRPTCKQCGKKVKFQGLTGGFRKFCCDKCRYKFFSDDKEIQMSSVKSVDDVNDELILKHFFEGKTPKQTASLIISYNTYLNHCCKKTKHSTINEHIFEYLKNRYDDFASPSETIYRIKHNVDVVPCCPVCGKNLPFTGLVSGYGKYCSRECYNVDMMNKAEELKSEKTEKHNDRLNITYKSVHGNDINDEVIENIFFKDKTQDERDKIRRTYISRLKSCSISKMTDVYVDVLDYLLNKRFKDSTSIQESLYRIHCHVEEKPCCPVCGKPISFYGKPGKPWHTYCSDKCRLTVAKTNLNVGYNPKSTSRQETSIFTKIKSVFEDAVSNYKDESYPHNCDIYIPSLELYIEYQGYFTHGNHPYRNNDEDRLYAEFLKNKHGDWAKESWTVTDVIKRKDAHDAGIRFLELWTKDGGKRRFDKILVGLHRMKDKSDKEVFEIIKEISLYETIYDGSTFLG